MKKYSFLILLLILFVSRIPKIILNTLINKKKWHTNIKT